MNVRRLGKQIINADHNNRQLLRDRQSAVVLGVRHSHVDDRLFQKCDLVLDRLFGSRMQRIGRQLVIQFIESSLDRSRVGRVDRSECRSRIADPLSRVLDKQCRIRDCRRHKHDLNLVLDSDLNRPIDRHRVGVARRLAATGPFQRNQTQGIVRAVTLSEQVLGTGDRFQMSVPDTAGDAACVQGHLVGLSR